MATITLNFDFDKMAGMDFSELMRTIYQYSLKIGRDIAASILESADIRLMETRDKSRYRNKGLHATSIKTILGEVEFRRHVYVDNAAVETGRCVYLLDEELGIEKIGLVSKDICTLAATAVCENTYRGAAKLISECTGLRISHQGVWNIVQSLGEMQTDRIERHAELAGKHQAVGVLDTPILYEENDGIWLALQGASRKEHGPSKEMKVGIAYDGVRWERCAGGKTRRTLNNKAAYASFEKAGDFRRHKEGVVQSRFNADSIQLRVLNGDGAGWLRNSPEPNAVSVLDKFHRNKKITECVQDPEFASLLRKLLCDGKIDTLLTCIQAQIDSTDDPAQIKGLKTLLRYYTENKDALLSYYDRGIPIPDTREPGTLHHARLGSMESNVFTLVGNRMKGRRACWSIRGGGNLVNLLCMYHTSGFEDLFAPLPALPDASVSEKPAYRFYDVPDHDGHGYEFWANSTLDHADRWLKKLVKQMRDDTGF